MDTGVLEISYGITGVEISSSVDRLLPSNNAFSLLNAQRLVFDLHHANTLGIPTLLNTNSFS